MNLNQPVLIKKVGSGESQHLTKASLLFIHFVTISCPI
jgi:hypothetical protein